MTSAKEFNVTHPIGTKVYYEPVLGHGHAHATATRSEAWEVCGSVIVMVNGVTGGVSIKHLTLIYPELAPTQTHTAKR
jgi:hypothetical protein